MEASLDSQVLHAALVLGDLGLVGVGQEVHEEKHQQVQSFSVNFFNVQTSDSQIFQVKFIIQNSALACESVHGVGIMIFKHGFRGSSVSSQQRSRLLSSIVCTFVLILRFVYVGEVGADIGLGREDNTSGGRVGSLVGMFQILGQRSDGVSA